MTQGMDAAGIGGVFQEKRTGILKEKMPAKG